MGGTPNFPGTDFPGLGCLFPPPPSPPSTPEECAHSQFTSPEFIEARPYEMDSGNSWAKPWLSGASNSVWRGGPGGGPPGCKFKLGESPPICRDYFGGRYARTGNGHVKRTGGREQLTGRDSAAGAAGGGGGNNWRRSQKWASPEIGGVPGRRSGVPPKWICTEAEFGCNAL